MGSEPLSTDAANRETYRGKVELRLYGPVLIVQCDNDPGDMGEPRVFDEEDGTTVVCVPSFALWPASEPLNVDRLARALAIVGPIDMDDWNTYAADVSCAYGSTDADE